MALDFPTSPTNGQVYSPTTGISYTYCSALGIWTASVGSSGALSAASLAQALTGTSSSAYSSPCTTVPKDAAGMTGAAILPSGTSAQRPGVPVVGMLRFNTDTGQTEYYTGSAWNSLGSGVSANGGTAVGQGALSSQTSGSCNSAFGCNAACALTTAIGVTAFGYAAYKNGNSNYNTAIGSFALTSGGGPGNTAVGYNALSGLTSSASQNSALGHSSGPQSSLGTAATSCNVYVGVDAGCGGGFASDNNVFIGYGAGANGGPGFAGCGTGNNVFIGVNAGYSNPGTSAAAGSCLIFLGACAGYSWNGLNSCNVILIGFKEQGFTTPPTAVRNSLSIGGNDSPAYIFVNNDTGKVSIGRSDTTNAYVKVAWTYTSDERDKTEIEPIALGLDFVNKLNPVSYKFRESRKSDTPIGDTRYGFLAQDILKLEGSKPVIVDTTTPDRLRYVGESMVPVLVNAVKDLVAKVEALEAEIATLRGQS